MATETISNRNTLLTEWKKAQAELEAAKAREAELRPQVIEAFTDIHDEMASGVENIDIGRNYTLKIERKLNYSLASANDYEKVDAALDAIEELLGDDLGGVVTSRLVKRKLEISITEYKKLIELPKGAEIKAIVDKVLTIKPGAASVKIEAPKAK